VEQQYRRLVKEIKYLGKIKPEILSVKIGGFVSVVTSLETVEAAAGAPVKAKGRLQRGLEVDMQDVKWKRVIAISVLRKWNSQWRLISHCATPLVEASETATQELTTSVKNGDSMQQGE